MRRSNEFMADRRRSKLLVEDEQEDSELSEDSDDAVTTGRTLHDETEQESCHDMLEDWKNNIWSVLNLFDY